jgi:predicted ester cyclase
LIDPIMQASDLSQQLHTERAAVETLYRAFSDNLPDLVDTVLAPDWDDIPLAPGQAPGPDGAKAIIGMLKAAFPDVRITINDLLQAPGKVAVRAQISGTHQGSLFGIAPTGKHVRFGLHEFHTLVDGRITTTWHMEDWLGVFGQLGQFPPQA